MTTREFQQVRSESDDVFRRIMDLHRGGRFDDAEALCRRLHKMEPHHFGALHILGAIHLQRCDYKSAARLIGDALELDDRSPFAWNAYGSALSGLKRFDEALTSYESAIALKPDFAQAFYNRANVLREVGRLEAALESYDRAIALKPAYPAALNNRGGLLHKLKKLEEALASYSRALEFEPNAQAFGNQGAVLNELERPLEALGSYLKAIELDPNAELLSDYATVLLDLHRLDEALAAFDRAAALDSDHAKAVSIGVFIANQLCQWNERGRRHDAMLRLIGEGKPISPFATLHVTDSPAAQMEAATSYCCREELAPLPRSPNVFDRTNARLRLAYVSADFRHHPVAYAAVELFELHDRHQFEIYGVSLHQSDGSPIRKRIESAFDRFIDAERMSDDKLARLLADLEVNIVVDLTGHTTGHRPGLFMRRGAPIAVNYFGYPATSGNKGIDYIIADRTVIPEASQCYFSEKVVYLPNTYFISDSKRPIAAQRPARGTLGLPEDGFVFCCFNNAYKITPDMLTVWARLLKRNEDSVLWLNVSNPIAIRNLIREIEARGVAAERLVFAPFILDVSEHLARLGAADLFLDTTPYNGHSTACDALYAGVPVVTCSGESFASRVAASVLHAAGLPKLITRSLEDYEALALELASDRQALRELREKLASNRWTRPLFDTDDRRRDLEAAYQIMWNRYLKGLRPQGFSVTASATTLLVSD